MHYFNAIKTVVSGSKEAGQTGDDLQEIAILREQDKRELIAVDELLANGELDRKVFVYQYQLSDGRTKDLREGAGGGAFRTYDHPVTSPSGISISTFGI